MLLSSNCDGNIVHWHALSGKFLHKLKESENQVMALDYTLSGAQFAAAGQDFHIRIYDEDTKSMIIDLKPGDWS